MSGAAALAALRAGGKAALARALAAVEARPGAAEVTRLLDAAFAAPLGHALGLTGPPGVGKSTLTDALLRGWRRAGRTVGVIAVDPSSRVSGGALLGDRTRISTDPEDTGVFLRSMAARDRLGGVAEITFPALVLMRALFDRVVVETVGVGQSETAVAGLCDTVVFCAQPGSGDALQFMKAGVMEVPDLVLVTKGDLGALADRAVADLRGALALAAGGAPPPVMKLSAARAEGVAEALAALDARADAGAADPAGRAARHAAQLAAWIEGQILDRFGRAGLRLAGPAAVIRGAEGPFTAAAGAAAALEMALIEAFRSQHPPPEGDQRPPRDSTALA